MRSFVILLLVALFTPVHLLSQEVVASQGDFSSTPTGSLSWTLGEAVTETVSDGTVTLTQGFQQVLISDAALSELDGTSRVELFPNPFHTSLSLFNNDLEGDYSLRIVDNTGKEVYNTTLNLSMAVSEYLIDLSELASGTYHLQINSEGIKILYIRIVKY